MTKNVGTVDRTLRIALGVALLIAAALLDAPERWFGLIGIVPLMTGLFGTCPLYSLFGIDSCSATTAKR